MAFHIKFSRALVAEKVEQMFPQEQWPEAFRILDFDNVHPDPVGQAAQARIQLAILKVSEGKLSQLKEAARMAKMDVRDVLTMAEYPSLIRGGSIDLSQEDESEDRQQYLDWINNKPGAKERD